MNKYFINKFSDLVIASITSVFVVMILMSSAVMAEDTEIYFGGGATNDALVRPNVLLVLDTSSSMTNTDNTGITRLDRMKTALHTIIEGANNVNMGLMRFHGEGGPVLYPVANLDEASTEIEGVTSSNEPISLVYSRINNSEDDAQESVDDASVDLTSTELSMVEKPVAATAADTLLEIQVATDNDDAEENKNGGMYRNSSDLELVKDGNTRGNQTIGIRFLDVNIPAGATITSAEIEFIIDEYKSGATNLSIVGEKVLNPAGFSSSDNDITDRLDDATGTVTWNSVDDPAVGDPLITPSITSIVTELISQPGWDGAGHTHDMVFIIQGSGKRTVESWKGGNGSDKQPLLRITYSTGPAAAATDEEQVVGLRFEDVGVPQGATITDAYIEFEAAATADAATSVVITAENVDDATASFTTVAGNLSARAEASNTTTASVDWTSVESWTSSEHYLTPDLKTVVQEVVNRSGWCGNNSMAFFVKGGSGLRQAVSYDSDTAAAPVLHINYDEDSVTDGACINQTFQAQIASGSQDVEQKSDGTMYSNSSDLELTNDGGNQTIGLRFTDVKIPQGTTILEAYLDFTSKDSQSGSTSLTIQAEKSADPGAFTSTANDLSETSRSRTSASESWSPGAWSTDETYTSPDLKSIIQEIVNQAAWDGGNALNMIISGTGLRRAWSNEGSPSKAPVLRVKINGDLTTGFKNVRDRLHDIVTELNWKSGTPIVDTLYEAAQYYRGDDVFYGNTRGNSHSGDNLTDDRSKYTRVSHPASYTGGTVVRGAGCTDDNLNSSSCISEQITGTATYNSPITLECQKNYMILLSDGQPSRNTAVDRTETMIGSSCAGSGSGKCGPEIAGFLKDEDQNDSIDEDQTVTTYTIGFNILSGGKTYLEGVAAAGGGDYQDAGSAADLVTAFENIIADILDRPTSFAAPSLSINAFTRLNHNNDIYFSLFAPDRNRRWNGNVKKYTICSGNEVDGNGDSTCTAGEILDTNGNHAIGTNDLIKDTAQSIWSAATDGPVIKEGGAGSKIPAYASRNLYTYTGSDAPSNVTLSGSAHTVNTSNTDLVGLIGNNLFSHAATYSTDETNEINEVIEWMQGKDVRDEDDDDDTTENRHVFSDALHSSAVAVSYGYPVDGNGNPSDGGDADDTPDFVTKLLVATNDGSIRMINAHNGIEEWAFIPQALLDQQDDLMKDINGAHIYGLDTTPTIRVYDANGNGSIEPAGTDINGNGSISEDEKEFIHAYVAMRRGGRNIYAFDITPAAVLTDRSTTNSISPKLLWRIEGGSGDFAALGETWSRPLPTSINYNGNRKDVLIFAGGYHTNQDDEFGVSAYGNAVYIVDAETGARLWWASGSSDSTTTGEFLNLAEMTYAIPSDIAIIDANSDGLTERLYVGDTGGQLWRIDLASTLSASTGARLATISSGTDDVDKRKFFYPPDVAQMNDGVFSDTKLYDLVTINTGNRSHPLDPSVHDVLYAFRDSYVYSVMPADFTPITTSEMFDVTDINIEAGTDDAVSLRSKQGWYINLQESDDAWIGEKGLGSPLIIEGKIFFTTYVPSVSDSDDLCKPAVEGNGRLYAINLLNGAAVYDDFNTADTVDGEHDLNIQDRRFNLSGGIPSSPGLWIPEGGDNTFVVAGTGGSAVVFNTKDGLLRKRTFWQQENIK